ncbi:MAG: hypothetical protein N3I35_03625 [Clostridia bacterium]|nr:hypothetical protein [Clostridia bacterium]
MSDFALLICKKEGVEGEKEKNFLKYLYTLLRDRVKEPQIGELLKSYELFDEVKAHIMSLPFSESEIGLKTAKVKRILSLLKEECKGICCIVPEKVSGMYPFEGFISGVFTGKHLYKSLLIQIIDEVYTKKNIEVSALDIAIIHSGKYGDLHTAISQLSPYVKFLTVVTEEKEQVEEEANELFYDTGLAVRVTNEYRSGLKSADLIINFADSKEFVFNTRINPRAIILNYGNINCSKILTDNTIINGLDIEIPQAISTRLGGNIFDYYSRSEIAEIIICYKTEASTNLLEGIQDFTLYNNISKEFKKMGFKITGFIGRRNIFKARDIVLNGA